MEANSEEQVDTIMSAMAEATDPEIVRDLYDKWAKDYEHHLGDMDLGYQCPKKLAAIVAAHLQDRSCRIIDIGAGTGLLGAELRQLGFTNIDAIDGSSGMLEEARSKQVYQQLYHELIGTDRIVSFPPGSYGALVLSGAFVPGHLLPQHLAAVLAAVAPGCLLFMAVRQEWLEHEFLADLEPEMLRMEEAGLWLRISWQAMENYHSDRPGKVYIYRKL